MDKFKNSLGIIFVVALVGIGIVLWFLAPGNVFSFSSFAGWASPLSRLFGVAGFLLFAVNILLSARFRFLENIFYGLNKVYERHAQIGKTGFYLMLFHPVLMFSMYANFSGWTFSNLFEFFTPSIDKGPVNWGILSLFSFIILVTLTLWFRPKYHIWKWTHRFMGVAFFFASAHAFLIRSTTAVYVPFRYYMLFIFLVATLTYIYHSVLGKFLIKKYSYVVASVKVLGGNITEVLLTPKGTAMSYTPGQFAFISFQGSKKVSSESHPFSLSSAVDQDKISFTMKNLGDFTSTLPNLEVGTEALIEGPFGKFSYYEARSKKQIWIAGGIGITPYLSMIQSLAKGENYSVDLFYCLRNEKEAVHLAELKNLENSKVRIFAHYSDTMGFINGDIIKEKSGGLEGKSIFLCAPPAMIGALRHGLKKLGVKEEFLHSEEFKL